MSLCVRNGLHQEQYVRRILRVLTILNEQKRLTNELLAHIWQVRSPSRARHVLVVMDTMLVTFLLSWISCLS